MIQKKKIQRVAPARSADGMRETIKCPQCSLPHVRLFNEDGTTTQPYQCTCGTILPHRMI